MTTPDGPGRDWCIDRPHEYWKAPEDEVSKRTQSFWVDPEPSDVGMLSARSIRFYQDKVNPMIEPFDPAQLGTATYELRIGPHWLHGDDVNCATREKPWIEIPPNSLVYVSMCERLRLPLYIAARFDLHISFIYRGLLLGTGPQVDPGFCGVLSCPLHNITNETVRIEVGEPFAKMEFLKTTPIVASTDKAEFKKLKTFPEVRSWAAARPEKDLPLIDPGKLWKKPITHYVKDRRPKSSVKHVEDRMDKVETTVGQFRVGGALGVFGVISLLVGVVTFSVNTFNEKVEPLAKQTTVEMQRLELEKARTKADDEQAKALAAEVKRLERRIRRLER